MNIVENFFYYYYYYYLRIFTVTRTHDSFLVRDLGFCNQLAETNSFVFCAVLLCFFSELLKSYSSALTFRTVSGFVIFVSVISSSKEIILILHRYSIILSFRAAGNTLTGTRNLGHIFRKFWPPFVLFLVSRNKRAKLGANRSVRGRSEHTSSAISILCLRRHRRPCICRRCHNQTFQNWTWNGSTVCHTT